VHYAPYLRFQGAASPYSDDVDVGSAGWLLTDGRSRMLMVDDEQDAENALILARQHSQHCFIGRGNTRVDRKAYVVEYWD